MNWIKQHTPEILISFGLAGMAATTILAIKQTPKVEEKRAKLPKKATKKEKALTLTPYIAPTCTFLASTALIITANAVGKKRLASATAAVALTEAAFADYKATAVKTLGEKVEKKIVEAEHEEKIKAKSPDNTLVITDGRQTLMYDALYGRYFYSNIDDLHKAVNKLNRIIVTDNYASVNDFYDALNVELPKLGDEMGWNLDAGEIDISIDSHLDPNNQPCIAFEFTVRPKYGYACL